MLISRYVPGSHSGGRRECLSILHRGTWGLRAFRKQYGQSLQSLRYWIEFVPRWKGIFGWDKSMDVRLQHKLTAWPLLRGPMSRKASVLSLSKSLKQGISPI